MIFARTASEMSRVEVRHRLLARSASALEAEMPRLWVVEPEPFGFFQVVRNRPGSSQAGVPRRPPLRSI
jgi:hypothetical protein